MFKMHAEPIFSTRPDRNTWFFNAAVAKAGINEENLKQIHVIYTKPSKFQNRNLQTSAEQPTAH